MFEHIQDPVILAALKEMEPLAVKRNQRMDKFSLQVQEIEKLLTKWNVPFAQIVSKRYEHSTYARALIWDNKSKRICLGTRLEPEQHIADMRHRHDFFEGHMVPLLECSMFDRESVYSHRFDLNLQAFVAECKKEIEYSDIPF